jgi:OPA family glycerol-3-phosphate transporter-like MFS transporter
LKFLMGSGSDRSNPRWFMPLGLLLSAAVTASFGLFKGIYASLTLIILLQALNGWFNGMGWPPSGKTMVHWFSARERGRVVSLWNTAHNIGGGLVAALAVVVSLLSDWAPSSTSTRWWRRRSPCKSSRAVARFTADLWFAARRGVPQ